MKFLSVPVDVAHATDAAFTDVDVTSNVGTDAGNVAGVLLEVESNDGTAHRAWAARKNGSTDSNTGALNRVAGHTYIWVGVDSDDIFELYLEVAASFNCWLIGYALTNEAEFNTNATDYSTSTTSTWVDIDISSETGANTAVAALFQRDRTNNSNTNIGLRVNGSTDTRNSYQGGGGRFIMLGDMVGLDGDEICEQYITNAATDIYLNGWLYDNFTAVTNGVDYQTATTGSYVDMDFSGETGIANAIGVMLEHESGTNPTAVGYRKNGESWDHYGNINESQRGIVEIDGSDIAEQHISDTNADTWYMGYVELSTDVPAGGGVAPVPTLLFMGVG